MVYLTYTYIRIYHIIIYLRITAYYGRMTNETSLPFFAAHITDITHHYQIQ
jgi:hypothetical protein